MRQFKRWFLLPWIVLILVGPIRAQISPGPLSRAHQDLEGATKCATCHNGIGTLLVLNKMMSPSGGKSSVASTETQSAVPQNPAHERALEEELKKKPGHPPILLRLAELERDAGRPAGAVPYLRQILEQDPKNEDARLELGRMLYDAGDVEGALKETQQLLADHPNQVDGLYNLGAIYANQNRLDLAREYWSKAVVTAPLSDSGRRAKDSLAKLGK